MQQQVAGFDGAIAELVKNGIVAGWLAVQAAAFRNVFLIKQVGCWLLFTWTDGSIEFEEEYPPFALMSELMAGTFRDEDSGAEYEVRWMADGRRRELWDRCGIREAPGHYISLTARRARGLR